MLSSLVAGPKPAPKNSFEKKNDFHSFTVEENRERQRIASDVSEDLSDEVPRGELPSAHEDEGGDSDKVQVSSIEQIPGAQNGRDALIMEQAPRFTIASYFMSNPLAKKEEYKKMHDEEMAALIESHLEKREELNNWKREVNAWYSQSNELPEKESCYAKITTLAASMEPALKPLLGYVQAMKVMDAAEGYRTSFLKREEEINSATTHQKQPFVQFAGTLNMEAGSVQKNLEKLEAVGTSLIEAHELLNNALDKANRSTDEPIKAHWVSASKNFQSCIDQKLLFAKQVKEGVISAARNTRAQGLNFLYEGKKNEAEAQGNRVKVSDCQEAATSAQRAVQNFQRAVQAGISEEEKKAWILAGSYRLEHAVEKVENGCNYSDNFELAADRAEIAGGHFQNAARAGISEEEKKAWLTTGYYELKHAEGCLKYCDGDEKIFAEASGYALIAAGHFQKAAQEGISKEEKNAWILAGSYRLKQAEAYAQNKPLEAMGLEGPAENAEIAAKYFQNAAEAGILEEEKQAWIAAGSYKLQQAKAKTYTPAWDSFNYAVNKALQAADQFKTIRTGNFSRNSKQAMMQGGFKLLQEAEEVAQAVEKEENNLNNAFSGIVTAPEDFQESTQEEIAEQEAQASVAAGFQSLQEAEEVAQAAKKEENNLNNALSGVVTAPEDFQESTQEGIAEQEEQASVAAGFQSLQEAEEVAQAVEKEENNLNNAFSDVVTAPENSEKTTQEGIPEQKTEAQRNPVSNPLEEANGVVATKKQHEDFYQRKYDPKRPPWPRGI